MTTDDRPALRRTARHIAAAMAHEWDPGLRSELRTCIAQWRFGDAVFVADELDARERHGCGGSITDERGVFRLSDQWVEQRCAEILAMLAALPRGAREKIDRDQRFARLGVRG